MNEEESIPEDQLESNNPKSSGESTNALPPASEEPTISKEELVLPGSLLAKTEKHQTETTEPSTLNPPPSTSTMEVHYHGHIHEKKKWKEYLFQFLMLFLAVTLGFIVENKREHYIEEKRASHLVSSLIEDLQKDTANLNWLDNFRLQKRKVRLDSFYTLLNMPPEKIDKKVFYPLFYRILEWYPFIQSNGTMNQLKNAGYLRYFSDNTLLEYISAYEFLLQDFKNDENMEFHLHYDKLVQLVKQNANNNDMYTFFITDAVPTGNGITAFDRTALNSLKAYTIEQMWYNKLQMIKQNNNVRIKAIEFMSHLQSIR